MFNLQVLLNNKKYLFFALAFIVFISIFIIIFFTRHYITYGFIPICRFLNDTSDGVSYYLNYNDIKQLSIFEQGTNNLINVDSSGLTTMKGTILFFEIEFNNNIPFTVDLYMHYSKTKNKNDFTSHKIASKDIIYTDASPLFNESKYIRFDISTDISKFSFKYFTFSLYISSPVNLKFSSKNVVSLYASFLFSKNKPNIIPIYRLLNANSTNTGLHFIYNNTVSNDKDNPNKKLIYVDSSGLTTMKGTIQYWNTKLNNNNSPFTVDLYMHYSKTKNKNDFTSHKIDSKTLKDIKYVSGSKSIIFDISTDISKFSFKYLSFSLNSTDFDNDNDILIECNVSLLFSKIKPNIIPICRFLNDTPDGVSYYLNYNDIKQLSIFEQGTNNLINVDSSGLTTMKGTIEYWNTKLNNNNSPFTVDLYMHYSKTKNKNDFTSHKIDSKTLKDIKYVSGSKNIIFDISTDISKFSFKYFTFSFYISSPINLFFNKGRSEIPETLELSLLFE